MEQAGWAQKTSILVGHSLVTLERLAILTPLHTIPMRDYSTTVRATYLRHGTEAQEGRILATRQMGHFNSDSADLDGNLLHSGLQREF